jgi:hypothetical protein
MSGSMRLDELTRSLHAASPDAGTVDPVQIRRRGRSLRTRRRAAAGAAVLSVAGVTAGAVTLLDLDGDTSGSPGVASAGAATINHYEQRVLDQVPGSYAVGGVVVVPNPLDPDSDMNTRFASDQVRSEVRPLGFKAFTSPGYLATTTDFPQFMQGNLPKDTQVVGVDGMASIGCVAWNRDDPGCSPAVLVGDAATGWFYLYGFGTDHFLQPGSEMEVFLDETYERGGPGQSVIGGFDGTDATRVELTLVDGSKVAATLDSGGISKGDTLFWAETPVEVAKVVAYDADGGVVASHDIRECSDPVDCEVR